MPLTTQQEFTAYLECLERMKKFPAVEEAVYDFFKKGNPFRNDDPHNVKPVEPVVKTFKAEYHTGVVHIEAFSNQAINIDNLLPRLFLTDKSAQELLAVLDIPGGTLWFGKRNDRESHPVPYFNFPADASKGYKETDVEAGVIADSWRQHPTSQADALADALRTVENSRKGTAN